MPTTSTRTRLQNQMRRALEVPPSEVIRGTVSVDIGHPSNTIDPFSSNPTFISPSVYRDNSTDFLSDVSYQRNMNSHQLPNLFIVRDKKISTIALPKKKKVFVDFHHASLFHSLHLLFEKRFGWELYHPIGMEWFEKGYWSIAEPYQNNIETVKQYLQLDNRYTPTDGTAILNDVVANKVSHYEVYDYAHEYTRKCLTFDQFCAMEIDYIIGSIPRHWEVYTNLRNTVKPNAEMICHLGNMFAELSHMIQRGIARNIMASVDESIIDNLPNPANPVKIVFYKQEFPLDVFYKGNSSGEKIIANFVNCFDTADLFKQDYHYFQEVRSILEPKGWKFLSYGAQNEHGSLTPISSVAHAMRQARYVWHSKKGGDGYGHIIHNAAACGRPLIGDRTHYRHLLGGIFFQSECSIDTHRVTPLDTARIIHDMEDEWYSHAKDYIHTYFRDLVGDFSRDAARVANFFAMSFYR